MNLPDWATHVAVDCDGTVWAYPAQPRWSGMDWINDHAIHGAVQVGTGSNYGEDGFTAECVPPEIAELLCVAIPHPRRASRTPLGRKACR